MCSQRGELVNAGDLGPHVHGGVVDEAQGLELGARQEAETLAAVAVFRPALVEKAMKRKVKCVMKVVWFFYQLKSPFLLMLSRLCVCVTCETNVFSRGPSTSITRERKRERK